MHGRVRNKLAFQQKIGTAIRGGITYGAHNFLPPSSHIYAFQFHSLRPSLVRVREQNSHRGAVKSRVEWGKIYLEELCRVDERKHASRADEFGQVLVEAEGVEASRKRGGQCGV